MELRSHVKILVLRAVGSTGLLNEAAARQGDVLVFEFSGFIVAGSSSVCHSAKSARPRFSRTGLLSTAQPAVPMNTESKNGDY